MRAPTQHEALAMILEMLSWLDEVGVAAAKKLVTHRVRQINMLADHASIALNDFEPADIMIVGDDGRKWRVIKVQQRHVVMGYTDVNRSNQFRVAARLVRYEDALYAEAKRAHSAESEKHGVP